MNASFVSSTRSNIKLTESSTAASAEEIQKALFAMKEILENTRKHWQTGSIIARTTGTISLIGSIGIIVHILRSYHGLSTTYHRLMLGLCIGDILSSSFLWLLGPVMVPKEMNYWVPGSVGNVTTCTVQGFVGGFGADITAYYNCSICLYYLAIVKYNKNEEFIRTKLEPWLHGVPLIVVLVQNLIRFFREAYNTFGFICSSVPNNYVTPHCNGLPIDTLGIITNIPCGRGHDALWFKIHIGVTVFVAPPIIIVGSMRLMYVTISDIERRTQRYGVASLRFNAQRNVGQQDDGGQNVNNTNEQQRAGFLYGMRRCFEALMSPSACCMYGNDIVAQDAVVTDSRSRRSGVTSLRKKAVLYKALGYSLAWASFWTPWVVFIILRQRQFEVIVVASILMPLQGFFNFIVFIMPKVRSAKRPRRGLELSWFEAFMKAYQSRGERRRPSSSLSSSNRINRSSLASSLNQNLRNLVERLSLRMMNIASDDLLAASPVSHDEEEGHLVPSGRGGIMPPARVDEIDGVPVDGNEDNSNLLGGIHH